MKCKYCGKECKSQNSLRNHERLCKMNPNRQEIKKHISGFKIWRLNHPGQKMPNKNRGKTKYTSEDLRLKGEKLHQRYLNGELISHQKGVLRTEEEKRKISETIRKNKNCGGLRNGSGRGKKGTYKGYYCDSTYELAYIAYNLDHNIEFKRCPRTIYYMYEYKGKIYKYYPDFILPDNSLVETKGYHSEIVDLKTNSVKDRKITVLYEKDLKYAFDYLKEKYKINNLEELYEN